MSVTNQWIANKIVNDQRFLTNLLFVEDIQSFALWNDEKNFFEILKGEDFEREVYRYMISLPSLGTKNITQSVVRDVVQAISILVHQKAPNALTPYFSLEDGTILNTDDWTFKDADKLLRSFIYLPIKKRDFENEPDCHRWKKFLTEVLVNEDGEHEPEFVDYLQEVMGYALLPTLQAHASFFFIGKGSNGKSLILKIIKEAIGNQFCDFKTIETLTTKEFAAAELLGKRLNICSEEESKYVKSDRLKALVSGDDISVRRLYRQGFTWKPTVKFYFSTNENVSFSGFNIGLLRRIHVLIFRKYFSEKKRNTKLEEVLLSELKGIIIWAMKGAQRLQKNNFNFLGYEKVNKDRLSFFDKMSSAVHFFNENFLFDPAAPAISLEIMYEEYVTWATKRGKKAINFYGFKDDLETIFQYKELIDGHLNNDFIYARRIPKPYKQK